MDHAVNSREVTELGTKQPVDFQGPQQILSLTNGPSDLSITISLLNIGPNVRHYAQWSKSRQIASEKSIKRAWRVSD